MPAILDSQGHLLGWRYDSRVIIRHKGRTVTVDSGDDLLAAVNLIPIEQLGQEEEEMPPIEVEVPAPSRNGNGRG